MPSSSGTPAATAAPNTSSRMISVPTIEICCDFASSARSVAPSALRSDAPPCSCTSSSGCAFWTAATAASGASATLSSASFSSLVSALPGSVKFTSTERPSLETVLARSSALSGLSMSETPLICAEAVDDVLDGGGDLRTVGLDRALALDQHALADLVGVVRVVDDHVVALGLAVAHLRRLEVLLADLAADHGGEDDEEDPAEDGCLAVRRAPSCRRAPRGCGVALWGVPPRGDRGTCWGTCADSQRSRPAPMRASLRPVRGADPSCGAASRPARGGWPRILR